MTPTGEKAQARSMLLKVLHQLDRQISEVERQAREEWTPPIAPEKIRDRSGQYMLTPLLVAKAQALHGLAMVSPS